MSPASALTVWGVWAIGAGLSQLITAIRVAQGLQGSGMLTGVAGYALLGAVFFLISAIRISRLLRTEAVA